MDENYLGLELGVIAVVVVHVYGSQLLWYMFQYTGSLITTELQ